MYLLDFLLENKQKVKKTFKILVIMIKFLYVYQKC